MAKSKRRALAEHRRRYRQQGVARVEVQVPAADAELVRALAHGLRAGGAGVSRLRAQLNAAVRPAPTGGSILDLLACDLPDEAFDEILDRDRRPPRPVDL